MVTVSPRMADAPAQLDYAQPRSWRERKAVRRAIFAAALLLVIFGSFKFFRPALNHAQMLHYQRQCMTHAEPPERTAFTSGALNPKSDTAWERFYGLFSPPGGKHGAIVFVHELRHSDGSPRLVAIEADLQGAVVQLDSTVIVPGGVLSSPQLRFNGSWLAPFSTMKFSDVHLHAGQVDPADPAHFTIAFEYANGSGTIDGWLRDDDSVLMELREPLSVRDQ
jgi:hypothetical protein